MCKPQRIQTLKSQLQRTLAKKGSAIRLKTFRLAITASGEYTQYWDDDDPSNGDARADAFAAIVNTVNRINEVYETDLGVRLQLVTDANLLYDDPFTDPFTGNLNQEAQSTLTAEVGEAQYDIGHLFGQGVLLTVMQVVWAVFVWTIAKGRDTVFIPIQQTAKPI